MNRVQSPTHFPRQVEGDVLEFDDWASEVRRRMIRCLRKGARGKTQEFADKKRSRNLKTSP